MHFDSSPLDFSILTLHGVLVLIARVQNRVQTIILLTCICCDLEDVSGLFNELGIVESNIPAGSDVITLLIDSFDCSRGQNFFKDAWNTFDFITVVGSIVDALVVEFGVRRAPTSSGKQSLSVLIAFLATKTRNRTIPGICTFDRAPPRKPETRL